VLSEPISFLILVYDKAPAGGKSRAKRVNGITGDKNGIA
jgi:hypothetical protein